MRLAIAQLPSSDCEVHKSEPKPAIGVVLLLRFRLADDGGCAAVVGLSNYAQLLRPLARSPLFNVVYTVYSL